VSQTPFFDGLLVTLGVIGFVLLGPLIAASVVGWDRWKLRRERRSPLTAHMLRGPGEALREQIDKLRDEVDLWLTYLVLLPSLAGLLLLAQAQVLARAVNVRVAITVGLIVTAAVAYFGWRCVKGIRHLWRLRLALDGEVSVGQELQNLMLQSAYVFHDFPAEGFNIDHVVIGPGGVVAVETKARSKLKLPPGQRTESVRVLYDGSSLKFPTHTETKPVEQAVRQAQWLARWLSSSVGWDVRVTPALAIPGWFIEHKAYEPVRVYNGKNPAFLLKPWQGQTLNPSQIRAIAHQVEQRCRNVRPNFLPEKD
jgi:Nuclease-related domain